MASLLGLGVKGRIAAKDGFDKCGSMQWILTHRAGLSGRREGSGEQRDTQKWPQLGLSSDAEHTENGLIGGPVYMEYALPYTYKEVAGLRPG